MECKSGLDYFISLEVSFLNDQFWAYTEDLCDRGIVTTIITYRLFDKMDRIGFWEMILLLHQFCLFHFPHLKFPIAMPACTFDSFLLISLRRRESAV